MKDVYLAGPITGLSYGEATDWRQHAKAKLAQHGIRGLDPMRCKSYLKHVAEFTADGDKYKDLGAFSSNRGIMTRDRFDATRCALLLVNFLGAERVSIGTCMEIAWADAHRIPIICAIEAEGNPHDHGMISEAIGFRVDNLDLAIEIAVGILL